MAPPTGHTRHPKTTNLPPGSSNPGPVSPVSLVNLTDPVAYYNAEMAAGRPARTAAYRPRAAGSVDSSQEPTPDAVISFQTAGSEAKKHEISGDDAKVVTEWYEGQIKKLYEIQMEALANENKEMKAHANTRDAFAIQFSQLKAELEAKEKVSFGV